MKNKILALVIFALVLQSNSFAQKIVRQSFSCLGTNEITEGILLRQTIGQPSNTTITSNENGVLRQGFQQALSANSANFLPQDIVEISIYPNPAVDQFNLSINGTIGSYKVRVTDVIGRLVINSTVLESNKASFLCDKWVTGVYFVSIISDKKTIAIKKIIKSN